MKYTDSLQMKIEFIYELLLSIRGDFGEGSALRERKELALKLTKLAIKEFNGRIKLMLEYGENNYYGTIEDNKMYVKKLIILEKTIKKFVPFKTDGRYFRDDFPHGYINMLEYFKIGEK